MIVSQLNNFKTYLQPLLPKVTLDDFNFLCFEITDFPNNTDVENILINEICNLPFISFHIEYYGSPYSTIKNFYSDLEDVFDNALSLDNLKIKITIDKKKLIRNFSTNPINTFVFINTENFTSIFTKQLSHLYSLVKFENKLKVFLLDFRTSSKLENDYIIIQGISQLNEISNDNISPYSISKFETIKNIFDYKKISYYTDIPHFWHFKDLSPEMNEFNNKCIIRFFELVSNKIIQENKIFLIRGHHNLELSIDDHFSTFDTQQLIELIDFTLDTDKHYDKILILRNVLTSYLNNFSTISQFAEQLESIYNSTKHQFSLYIQNEIKIFIEQKNQVLNETHSVARQISHLTSEVTGNLKNSIISLLATLIASSIPDIGEKLDNKFLMLMLSLVFGIYLATNLYYLSISKNQLKGSLKNFKTYLNYISSQSLEGLNFENLKKDFIEVEIEHFDKTVRLSKIIYLTLIIFTTFIILYLIGFC